MAFVSPRMNLKVWNAPQDPYDHEQLADNFLKLDRHDHSEGRGAQIGSAGIQSGAITNVHLTNGAVTSASLAPGVLSSVDATSLYAPNRIIRSAAIKLDAATVTAAGTYALLGGGHSDSNVSTTASTTNHPMLGAFWLEPNGTAPGATFNHQMYRINSTAGGVTTITPTLGTNYGALTVSVPTLGVPVTGVSADFTNPTAGGYLMTVTSSGSMVANSSVIVRADLQVRYV
jgi:hypothetical protein